MKAINLKSLVDMKANMADSIYEDYKKYTGIELKEHEMKSLESFLDFMENDRLFLDYFVGYKIPQIGKEFDLLKFGENCVINIELKSTSTIEKIKNQLMKNKYYLEAIEINDIWLYSYDASENKLYTLGSDDELYTCTKEDLKRTIESQTPCEVDNPDIYFNPSDYLVSPFNSTDKFLEGQYFLTNQQTEFKRRILKDIDGFPYFESVIGRAGTGKTLLIYDIAKKLMKQGKKVGIIHCGKLNDGQLTLNRNKWLIKEIKEYKMILFNEDIDVIIIDEMQRIRPNQLSEIIDFVNKKRKKCIVSYDINQCINQSELGNLGKVVDFITNYTNIRENKLSEKIRSNKEIGSFIINLFELESVPKKTVDYNNISVEYLNEASSVKQYLEVLTNQGWTSIKYSSGLYEDAEFEEYQIAGTASAHRVIGQEFDNIVVVIDHNFYYDSNLYLKSRNPKKGYSEYLMNKMLYQMVTRTRKKLKVIVLNNPIVFEKVLNILNGNPRANLPIPVKQPILVE